jgi:hypothetical protein
MENLPSIWNTSFVMILNLFILKNETFFNIWRLVKNINLNQPKSVWKKNVKECVIKIIFTVN